MASARQLETLARLEQRIDQLPLLPEAVVGLLRLDPGAEQYFDEVHRLIRSDPALAVRVLRFANSASAAPQRQITSIEQALLFVGCKPAVALISGHSAMRVFVPSHEWQLDLWRHAFDVACLMQALAAGETLGSLDAGRAYLFGLLHDIGRFVMYLEAPDDLRAVNETDWGTPQQLIDAEIAVCGFTHAELGCLAVRKWRLPEELALIVRKHHDPPAEQAGDYRLVIERLQQADRISVAFGVHRDLWRSLPDDQLSPLLQAPRHAQAPVMGATHAAALVRAALGESVRIQQSLGIAPSLRNPAT